MDSREDSLLLSWLGKINMWKRSSFLPYSKKRPPERNRSLTKHEVLNLRSEKLITIVADLVTQDEIVVP
mgnify:CR=1 FL=1